MRKVLGFLFLLSVFPGSLHAETLPADYSGSIGILLHQADQLAHQGRYQEAQKKYEKALEEIRDYTKKHSQIRASYEQANIRWLFSKSLMPGSKIYKVKAGEALFDIAKKYGTNVELLRRSNHLKRDQIHEGMKLKVVTARFSIRVDKSKNILELQMDKKALKHYRVATGRSNTTPVGDFKIINRIQDPAWYKKVGVVIPPGTAENHLGTRWLGFDQPGYGIHGTVEPQSIGKQASSGCVRMLNQDVEELYDIVPLGTEIVIQD